MPNPEVTFRIKSKDETKDGISSAKESLDELKGKVRDISSILKTTLLGGEMFAGFRMLKQVIGDVVGVLRENDKELDDSLKRARSEFRLLISEALDPLSTWLTKIADKFADIQEAARTTANVIKEVNGQIITLPGFQNIGNQSNVKLGPAPVLDLRPDAKQSAKVQEWIDNLNLGENWPFDYGNFGKDVWFTRLGLANMGISPLPWLSSRVQWDNLVDLTTRNYPTPNRGSEFMGIGFRPGEYSGLSAITGGGLSGVGEEVYQDPQEFGSALEEATTTGIFSPSFASEFSEKAMGSFDMWQMLGDAAGGPPTPEAPEKTASVWDQLNEQLNITGMLMSLLNRALGPALQILGPALDRLLLPVSGLFATIATKLLPVFEVLTPVVKVLADIFVWLYNKVILPLGNVIIAVGGMIYDVVAGIYNAVAWVVNGLGGDMKKMGYWKGGGFLTEITPTDVSAGVNAAAGFTAASGAQYSSRDITVNIGQIQVNTDVIAEGGFRDLALKIYDEIESAIALGLRAA